MRVVRVRQDGPSTWLQTVPSDFCRGGCRHKPRCTTGSPASIPPHPCVDTEFRVIQWGTLWAFLRRESQCIFVSSLLDETCSRTPQRLRGRLPVLDSESPTRGTGLSFMDRPMCFSFSCASLAASTSRKVFISCSPVGLATLGATARYSCQEGHR